MRSVTTRAIAFWLAVDGAFKAAILPVFLPLLGADHPIDVHLAWWWAVGAAVVLGASWAVPLAWMLRPIARWQRLPSSAHTPEVVLAASRAAVVIPWRFSLLWAAQWQILFGSLLLITRGSTLTATVVGGTILMMITAIAGPWAVGHLLCGWLLGETRARLWLQALALGVREGTPEMSLRLRLTAVALCIGFAPFLYLATVTYVREVGNGVTTPATFLLTLAACGVAVAFYAPLCALLVARGVADPVARMADVLREIARTGDARSVPRIPRYRADEVGALADVANAMIDRLEHTANERAQFSDELEELNHTLQQRVEAARARVREGQRQLVAASRRAGMSQVATSVLHNVGNVLNSLNVSAQIIRDRVAGLETGGLAKAAAMLRRDGGERLAMLGEYLERIDTRQADTRRELLGEIGGLGRAVDHIKQIVSRQQTHARADHVHESVRLEELVEDALTLTGLSKAIRIERDYEPLPMLVLDRHRLLEILVNLMGNASDAIDAHAGVEGVLRIVLRRGEDQRPRVEIHDNGIGIAPEHHDNVFAYGFTTKIDGHGFGLHASANAATEMGAAISCASEGMGKGACFVVVLPAGDAAAHDTHAA